jgi:hypothetical protein
MFMSFNVGTLQKYGLMKSHLVSISAFVMKQSVLTVCDTVSTDCSMFVRPARLYLYHTMPCISGVVSVKYNIEMLTTLEQGSTSIPTTRSQVGNTLCIYIDCPLPFFIIATYSVTPLI